MLLVSRCSGMLRDAAVDHGVLDLVLTFLQIPAASIMIFYYKGLQSKRCATRDDFRHSVTCDVLKYLFECFGACYERVWKNKCLTLCVKGELVLCVEGGGEGLKASINKVIHDRESSFLQVQRCLLWYVHQSFDSEVQIKYRQYQSFFCSLEDELYASSKYFKSRFAESTTGTPPPFSRAERRRSRPPSQSAALLAASCSYACSASSM